MLQKINRLDQATRFNILKNHAEFNSDADRYLKVLPLIGILACDILKVKTRHKIAQQILIALLGEVIRKPSIYVIKHTTHHLRPNLSLRRNSFPSGHTATGFMCAEIMRNELMACSKVLAFSGYSVAALTGLLRLYKNKHWLSDVLAGAACGIVSAMLAYKLVSKLKVHTSKKENPGLGKDKEGVSKLLSLKENIH